MHVSVLTLLAFSAVAIAQPGQVRPGQPTAVTVSLGAEATVSFRLSQRVVTDIEIHLRGADYSVPLRCAGGLHDVSFDTVVIDASEGERATMEGSFILLFDMGNEQDRRFGKLPRVQFSFYRRRLTEMLVTRMTGEKSAFSSKLCESVPVGPVTCKDTRQLQGLAPDVLVEQLRGLPAPMPATGRLPDSEIQRRNIYEELLDWGASSIPSLVRGLKDPDVRLRRNVLLAFDVLGGGWWPFECGHAKIDIRSALPALMVALRDSDSYVRAWAAAAIGDVGANAAEAVPVLTELLEKGDEGSRNSACLALGKIGPAARSALPALRTALSDKSQDVRRFAARAIQLIEQ